MSDAIGDALAAIAREPAAAWPQLVAARFPDDAALRAQALLWLRAGADGDEVPAAPGGDRYRLDVCLGRGATAAVWQAFDEKLGRPVALKIFHAGEAAAAVQAALAEARAACDVVSDHVVRVLDVHDDGAAPCIVMELVGEHDVARDALVPGESAAAQRPRSLAEAVRWVRDAARGVHDAHLRNVFHRDLKPQNLLVAPVTRRARVGDFGLAVSAAGDATARPLERGGAGGAVRVAGTPAFMAPEQARGLPVALDPRDADDRARLVRVDVWGLGALAYALIGGGPPWQPRGDADAWEIAAAGEAPPPLARTAAGARVPRRLRRVIARAMAIDPEARYPSAGALAHDLDAYLAQRPTTFERGPAARAWRWTRRNPQLALAALIAAALAVGTITTYVTVRRLRAERRELVTDVAAREVANDALERRAAQTLRALDAAQKDVRGQTEALVSLQHALAEAQREYQEIIAAKEQALRTADEATRALVDELAQAKSARDAAQFGRAMYQSYWTAARSDAERAQHERDAAQATAAAAARERDDAAAARAAAERDRDQARGELAEAIEARARAEAEVARLTAAEAAAHARIEALEKRVAEAGGRGAGGVGAGAGGAGVGAAGAGGASVGGAGAGGAGVGGAGVGGAGVGGAGAPGVGASGASSGGGLGPGASNAAGVGAAPDGGTTATGAGPGLAPTPRAEPHATSPLDGSARTAAAAAAAPTR